MDGFIYLFIDGLQDHKGAIRMKGLERTLDGRCRIGSQFMIWVGDLEYKVNTPPTTCPGTVLKNVDVS